MAIELAPKMTQALQAVTEFKFNTIPISLVCCYNYIRGAVATIACVSDVRQSKTQVSGPRQFTLSHSKQGVRSQIQQFFNSAKIKEQCLNATVTPLY